MIRHLVGRSLVIAIGAALLLAPVTLADTCCANTEVTLEPGRALPGETVSLHGIRCLNADNSGPLPLNVRAFWLSSATVEADQDPASVPGSGVGIPPDVPPVDQWLPLASTGKADEDSGSFVVPDLPDGSYQLWWLCDNGGGPGSGIHYSGGARLAVGLRAPETSTEDPLPPTSPILPLGFIFSAGVASLLIGRRARPALADRE